MKNDPQRGLHDAPFDSANRLCEAEPTLARGMDGLGGGLADLDHHATTALVGRGEAEACHPQALDPVGRIGGERNWPLEPVEMEVATSYQFDPGFVAEREAGEGIRDVLPQSL